MGIGEVAENQALQENVSSQDDEDEVLIQTVKMIIAVFLHGRMMENSYLVQEDIRY
jgi:hypothetical protein